MMLRLLAAFFTALAITAAFPVHTVAQDARASIARDIEREVKDLIELQALEAVAETWRQALREPGPMLQALQSQGSPDEPANAWRRAVDSGFDVKVVANRLARAQAEGLDEPQRKALVTFRSTVLGRSLTVAESTSPLPQEDMANQAKMTEALVRASGELQRDPVRRRLIDRLISESGGIAMQVELLMGLSRGLAVGISQAQAGGQPREGTAEIIQRIEKERPAMTAMMTQIGPASLQLSYRKLSNADLEAYVKYLVSPAGRKNTAVTVRAFSEVISERGLAIGEAFAKELSNKRL